MKHQSVSTTQLSVSQPSATAVHGYVVWSLVVIAVGAALRLFMLTNQSLWYDEGVSLVVTDSRNLAETYAALWDRAGGDKYQPVYFLVLALWRSVFGDSELALRMLSVIPGALALLFVHATARRLFDDKHALWTTLYLSVSAFWICYSQEVRPYALLFLLASVQIYLLTFALEDRAPRARYIAAFALVTAVSCLASILLAFFTVALAVSHLVAQRRPGAWLAWWGAALFACLPVLWYFLMTPAAVNPSGDSTNGLGVPLYKNAVFSLYGLLVGHTYGPPLGVLRDSSNMAGVLKDYALRLAVLGAVIIGLLAALLVSLPHILASTGRRARSIVFVCALLVTSLAVAFVVASLSKINWMPRHSFYLSLSIALLLPLIVIGREGVDRWRTRFAGTAFAMLVALNVFASFNYFYKSEYWRDDYRSAAGYLVDHIGGEDQSILLWGEPRLLSYYGDSATMDGWRSVPVAPLSSKLANVDDGTGNIFVAINREFTWSRSMPAAGPVESQVEDDYALVSVQKYVNFNIYEFRSKHGVVTE